MGSGEDERTFAGRYTLPDKLGSGGFGTVWRAHDQQIRSDVALKSTNESASDPASAQRFEREARVIARLSHENIVKIGLLRAGAQGGGGGAAAGVVEVIFRHK